MFESSRPDCARRLHQLADKAGVSFLCPHKDCPIAITAISGQFGFKSQSYPVILTILIPS